MCVCSECRQPWNSFWVTATIRIPSAPGNLVALSRKMFRELEQGIFWEVKKAGKAKCKINWTYRAGIVVGSLPPVIFKKDFSCSFSFLLFPYFHSSSIFFSCQLFFVYIVCWSYQLISSLSLLSCCYFISPLICCFWLCGLLFCFLFFYFSSLITDAF